MEKLPRNSTEEDRAALKAATRHSLKKAVASKFTLVTRVVPSALSDYGSMKEPDFMPVDIVLDLQREFPQDVPSPLLATLAELAGFRLVPLDTDDDGQRVGVDADDVGWLIKEGGEAKTATLRAIGTTCLDTVRTARRESEEARDAYAVTTRKLSQLERRILARAV